jgi:endothelin-converting enzyme/putative endopeptidase
LRAVEQTAPQHLAQEFIDRFLASAYSSAALQRAITNEHSPNEYRINGVVSNMPEFSKAFSCKPGQPMLRAQVCRVW